ncbi:S-adenosyl-L-methionine-dependent methyltransferase [Mycena vulgaris]|nr:S-adenosyl-L-methionine-dependent methyltransferase [Mycena vulgaris]
MTPPCDPAELQRLDEMHGAISAYFGGQLCLAPLAEERPRRIIDLGCGSGAWAIQAANQFPEAEVIAVDIFPLPNRTIPSNMQFQRVDLTEALTFEPGTFDIVHSRFVMVHVPNGKDAIERAARLVRPGGLLLMEDMDINRLAETGGPAVHKAASTILEFLRVRGADGSIGKKLESIMTSLDSFEQVHVKEIAIPLCGTGGEWLPCIHPASLNCVLDPSKSELGAALKQAVTRGFVELDRRQVVAKDTAKEYSEELGQKGCEGAMYFSWARRSWQ